MLAEKYLIAKVNSFNFGVYCKDVTNVYSQKIKITRIMEQGSIYLGIIRFNNTIMKVIDLKSRLGFTPMERKEKYTFITFKTSNTETIALIVDEITGMKDIAPGEMTSDHLTSNNVKMNINLLFPKIYVKKNGEMIHIIDSTYLDKTEKIDMEESGELEFF